MPFSFTFSSNIIWKYGTFATDSRAKYQLICCCCGNVTFCFILINYRPWLYLDLRDAFYFCLSVLPSLTHKSTNKRYYFFPKLRILLFFAHFNHLKSKIFQILSYRAPRPSYKHIVKSFKSLS